MEEIQVVFPHVFLVIGGTNQVVALQFDHNASLKSYLDCKKTPKYSNIFSRNACYKGKSGSGRRQEDREGRRDI